MLKLKAIGIKNILQFPFPTCPPRPKLVEAINTLIELKALEGDALNFISNDCTKLTKLG